MFSRFQPEKDASPAWLRAEVCDSEIRPEARAVRLTLRFDGYVGAAEIEGTAQAIAERYGLYRLDITPLYPPQSLADFDFSELAAYLGKIYPPLQSTLAGSKWTPEGENIRIALRANGKDLLKEQLPKAQQYLKDRFDRDVRFSIETNTAEEDVFQQTQMLREQALSEIETPKFSDGEKKPAEKKRVIYGRSFRGETTPIGQLELGSSGVVAEGEVFNIDHRELKKRSAWVVAFDMTDYTGSVHVSRYMEAEEAKPILAGVKVGMWLRVRGRMTFDRYDNDTVLQPDAIIVADKPEREDSAEGGKRVELHLHTQMSSMDALTDVKAVIQRAAKWGHRAIAITDHGVAQSFPDAMAAASKATVAGTDEKIKVLYGCEAYYYNDVDGRAAVHGDADIALDEEYVAFDLETTGLDARKEEITEIGAAIFRGDTVVAEYKQFVNPQKPLSPRISELTGITDAMLADAPTIDKVLPEFLAFCGDRPLAAHNAEFDIGFVRAACRRCKIDFEPTYIDSLVLAQNLLPQLEKHKLNLVADALSLPEFNHHRALDDALTVGYMLARFAGMLEEKGVSRISQINNLMYELGSGKTAKQRPYHMILLAKNQCGLRNLYKLISYAHLRHYYRVPRVPKSELLRCREGLLIGSACEAGELFRAVVEGKPHSELVKIAKFYDYLEIQPLCNNRFMIERGLARNDEDLREFNRVIVQLGEELGKPVVATGDVHFLDAKDEQYRRILLAAKKMLDGEQSTPLYFRTTDEMLEEFGYLGAAKAHEVVVENPNRIADMCDAIRPVPKNLFAPKIENSVEDLQRLVYGKLKRLYGDNPPELIRKRVETEMHDIISCHYDVIYMSAQKLVQNSLENGYLVGSRGSVGSSIVAYLSGITEVNSFPPHYRCPKCQYTTFDVPKEYGCGADLPDAVCPQCGAKLDKDGFNIPFETFLGFGGDKVPDIDLNFSGEYQARAHAYCVEMFGSDHVFRAGTISGVEEKTAHGYVKKYMELTGNILSRAEENRLALGCVGVKRTTGQHPGGLVVIPQENEIWDFCPVQHPADAVDKDAWITTHFDYHKMEENLLKLDMLGHDDPTMIRMLQVLTGIDPQTIPLDDKDTMSIFTSSKVLGYENDPLLGPTGALTIPEFGTRNARNMLVETKPTAFDTLVRLSGFSHGTDVWHGNIRDLVLSGTADVNECVGCRDDIMLYLISKGMEEKRAFKFMEAVRKGAIHKGKSWPDGIVEEMQQLGVPEWYIESCRKIQYLFPKAHAVAYVMMAFRIAGFKVHEPLAFYAAYFYRRSQKGSFDAAMMTQGMERVKAEIKRIESDEEASAKDADLLVTLEACYEFYLRGFSFARLDLYRSDATKFVLSDGKLIPPFKAVAGLGETVAEEIVKCREGKEFLSVDEFALACPKVSETLLGSLKEAGAFGDLPETSQISLF
ncbi:MAG: PolC-type DNA polymerase III [Oscillospiraceae bacterium]|nr:PolC-type DNA polymerase III [Oscillospiraceae bacterium]